MATLESTKHGVLFNLAHKKPVMLTNVSTEQAGSDKLMASSSINNARLDVKAWADITIRCPPGVTARRPLVQSRPRCC